MFLVHPLSDCSKAESGLDCPFLFVFLYFRDCDFCFFVLFVCFEYVFSTHAKRRYEWSALARRRLHGKEHPRSRPRPPESLHDPRSKYRRSAPLQPRSDSDPRSPALFPCFRRSLHFDKSSILPRSLRSGKYKCHADRAEVLAAKQTRCPCQCSRHAFAHFDSEKTYKNPFSIRFAYSGGERKPSSRFPLSPLWTR